MDETIRKNLVDKCEALIVEMEAKQGDVTDWVELTYEELKCISECLQFGQLKEKYDIKNFSITGGLKEKTIPSKKTTFSNG